MPSETRQFIEARKFDIHAVDRPTVFDCANVADWWNQHVARPDSAQFRAKLRHGDVNCILQIAQSVGVPNQDTETICHALAYVDEDDPTQLIGTNILDGQTIVRRLHRVRFNAFLGARRADLDGALTKIVRMQPRVSVASIVATVRDWDNDATRRELGLAFERRVAEIGVEEK